MIVESRIPDGVGEQHLASLSLTFAVTLRQEEGGEMHELIPGGGVLTVTIDNMYDYVKKYAKLRMVKINAEPLEVCVCTCMHCLYIVSYTWYNCFFVCSTCEMVYMRY